MCAYIMKATAMPSPWHVSPATTIDTPDAAGCVSEMTEAMVPDSMMGKMGRIHVGIIDCRPKLCVENTYEYWPTATLVVRAT